MEERHIFDSFNPLFVIDAIFNRMLITLLFLCLLLYFVSKFCWLKHHAPSLDIPLNIDILAKCGVNTIATCASMDFVLTQVTNRPWSQCRTILSPLLVMLMLFIVLYLWSLHRSDSPTYNQKYKPYYSCRCQNTSYQSLINWSNLIIFENILEAFCELAVFPFRICWELKIIIIVQETIQYLSQMEGSL